MQLIKSGIDFKKSSTSFLSSGFKSSKDMGPPVAQTSFFRLVDGGKILVPLRVICNLSGTRLSMTRSTSYVIWCIMVVFTRTHLFMMSMWPERHSPSGVSVPSAMEATESFFCRFQPCWMHSAAAILFT